MMSGFGGFLKLRSLIRTLNLNFTIFKLHTTFNSQLTSVPQQLCMAHTDKMADSDDEM